MNPRRSILRLRYQCVLVLLLALGAAPFGCGDTTTQETSEANELNGCTTFYDPTTCYYASDDSVNFHAVELGDTLEVNFCINNYNDCGVDPYCRPGGPITVGIGPSTCADFSWSAGRFTVEENDAVALRVRFHPKSTGTLRCKIPIAGCRDMRLEGLGTVEGEQRTDSGGFGLKNSTTFNTRLLVSYRKELCCTLRDTVEVFVAPGEDRWAFVPWHATDIQVQGASATGDEADPWKEIYRFGSPRAVMKCYEVKGTVEAPDWSELAGCNSSTWCGCSQFVVPSREGR